MQTRFFKQEERGQANHGWLKARHSFSFSNWYNPELLNFGALRVLNDDTIAPGMGFGMHPHNDMEIITIPLGGSVAHRDNTGGQGLISVGEVQVMSAGSGIMHSEVNGSQTEELSLFQIWIITKTQGIAPRYDQRKFDFEAHRNSLVAVASPLDADNALWINQDARVLFGHADAGVTLNYVPLKTGNGVFTMVVEGNAEIGAQLLGRRDAVGVWDTPQVPITMTETGTLLLIDVPMHG